MAEYHFKGLTDEEVLKSRELHGSNILTPPEKDPWWKEFLAKLGDPIIIILLVALVLSVGVSFYEFTTHEVGFTIFLEPIGILVAILLATVVSYWFERSANQKFEVLNKVNDDTLYKVIRNNNLHEVYKKDIVVDDVIIFEVGEEIPADGLLLEAVSLQIDESSLTGEPIARKTTDSYYFDKEATYPSDHVMKGTSVVDGHGIMRVLKVGDGTEYGKVYEGAQIDHSIKTPLDRQLNKLATLITRTSYGIASLIFIGRLLGYFMRQDSFAILDWLGFGEYLLSTLMIAVTVIVVAVPEGLPMSVTLSLAMSMKRMLATNNLVRKMHACETMGAVTVICTDKTGTLTQNQMTVHEAQFYGVESGITDLIKESIAINSTAYLDFTESTKIKTLGNPTEAALLLWLNDNKIDYLPIREEADVIKQITFSTERKYMATLVRTPLTKKKILLVKGAPEIILEMCQYVPIPQGEIQDQLLSYQNKAMRTLGFAYQVVDENTDCMKDDRLVNTHLIFQGIVAISDPIRKEVPFAIEECMHAGIGVKIVTGDTPGTAKEIGRQIGLYAVDEPESHHMTGTEFAAMEDEELLTRIDSLKIMSRARPMDKQRLVQLLQKRGHVVAVTGDGTNDAPALNAAQVGLSMGDGTTVAKEASDITILDNSFASISRAVMWGRSLYQNIQRFILFQMTINVAACLIVLIGAFLGTQSPLTVTQMLWVNLVMDTFAALALASLPPSDGVMKDKPRKTKDHIITKSMAESILGVGLLFVVLLLSLVQYFKHADITSLTAFNFTDYKNSLFNFSEGNGLSKYELSLFFTIFVMLQVWNMFNAKAFMSGKSALADLKKGNSILSIALIIVVGQWLIVTFGGEMFSVTSLKVKDWVIIIASTSVVLWIGELLRLINRLEKKQQ